MIFYFLWLSPLIYFSLVWKKSNVKLKDNLIFFLIIFILAFNYQLGTDWIPYQNLYEKIIPKLNFKNLFNSGLKMERGYIIINYIFSKYLRFNYELFMGSIISGCIYIFLKILKKKSENYYISIFLYITGYLFVNSMEPVIRQLIATAIIMCGLKYIEKKNFIKFTLVILVATQFHSSSLLLIFLYFLDKFDFSLKKTIILGVIIFFTINNLKIVLDYLFDIVPYLKKYNVYFSSLRYNCLVQISLKGMVIKIIQNLVYFFIIFCGYNKYRDKRRYIKNAAIILVLLSNFMNLLPILYRIRDYLMFFFVIAISSVVNIKFIFGIKINKNITKLFTILILILNLSLFFRGISKTELNRYRFFPYKNYFIEIIKGNISKNNDNKIRNYKTHVDYLIKKEDGKK